MEIKIVSIDPRADARIRVVRVIRADVFWQDYLFTLDIFRFLFSNLVIYLVIVCSVVTKIAILLQNE